MALIRSDNGYYTNINTATTTLVRTGPGALLRIVINTAVASSSITMFDSLTGSGTKIGTITLPATLLTNSFVYEYRVQFNVGLTLVTVGTSDITVSWIGG